MSEPTTVLTDYLLAAVAIGLAWRLSSRRAALASRLWAASFLVLGVAALVGGTWHAIPPGSAPALRAWLWSITYICLGLADLLILGGAVQAALPQPRRTVALVFLVARFLVYAALILARHDFRDVGVEFGLTLLLLLAFGLHLRRRRHPASALVLGGVLVSLAGGLVQALGLSLPPLNHNDIYHLVQTAGLWLLYAAALSGLGCGTAAPSTGEAGIR